MKKTNMQIWYTDTRGDHAASWFKVDKWWIFFPMLQRKEKNMKAGWVSDCTPWLEDLVLELSSKSPVDSTEEEEEMEG